MEVKKAIKQMVALGTGLAMVGATIFGAAATDLSEYPSPMFIKDGKFNGVIVFGDSAAASDVAGAVDIATSLQYASTTVSEVSTSSAVNPVVSDGVRIAKSGDELNLAQDLADVEDKFDDVDLPEILPDGVFEDEDGGEEDYTQLLVLGAEAQVLKMFQDEDDAPEAAVYLHIVDGKATYNYTLEFDDAIAGTNASETQTEVSDLLEGARIEIQGNDYTITDVELGSAQIDKFTLQAGESTVWLEEGVELDKPVAGVSHKVILQDVNEDESKCGILIDGTLTWVDKGKTKTVNGLDIGVTDAIVVHSAGKDTDVCEVNLGAAQLVLEDGKKVSVNGYDIKGSSVDITVENNEWTGFIITYSADEDEYLESGETWEDPVFGNFEIKYAGLTETTEEIKVSVTGTKDAELRFMNNDNKEVVIPFFYDGTKIIAGEAADKPVLSDDTTAVCTWTTDIEDCEDYYIFTVASSGESHLIQIEDIDVDDNEIVIEDITYGKTYTDDFDEAANATVQTISLGSYKDITLTVLTGTSKTVTVGSYQAAEAETKYDGVIDFNNTMVTLSETDTNKETEVALTKINVSLKYDASDDMQIGVIQSGATFYEIEEDSDVDVARTAYGTLIETDTEDDDYVTFMYPDEATYGNVFISPFGAEVVSGASGGSVTTTVVQKIQVGAAKLASEVSDIRLVNAVVVGGPCANGAAANLMGNPEKCWESIPQNKAIIKLYQNGANVALLVAGSTALDTRRATRVLANFDDYTLTGMEVEVTGQSLTDITVSAPQ